MTNMRWDGPPDTKRPAGPGMTIDEAGTFDGTGVVRDLPVSASAQLDAAAEHPALLAGDVSRVSGFDFLLLRRGDLAVEDMDRAVASSGVSRCYPYRDRWRWLRRLYMQRRASSALLRSFTARLSRHTPHSLRTLMDLHLRSGVDLVCPVVDERGHFDI